MKTFQPHTPRTGALLTSLLVNAVLLGGVLTQFAHGAGHLGTLSGNGAIATGFERRNALAFHT